MKDHKKESKQRSLTVSLTKNLMSNFNKNNLDCGIVVENESLVQFNFSGLFTQETL